MFTTANEGEARCYEALCLLLKDRDIAWGCMKSFSIDGKNPLPVYSEALIERFNCSQDDIDEAWHFVREAFDRERIVYTVLKEGDELFPANLGGEKIHYLYCAGNVELLRDKRITFIGMSHPSLQGKSDILDTVSEAVGKDIAIMAPLDTGLGAFALSVALKENGKAIAMLQGGLSKCPSEGLLQLQGDIYSRGLLLSIFAPSVKFEKYHVVYRNKFLAGISKAVYLAEEKDGGPSWAIFDPALGAGIPAMISSSMAMNPNFTWVKAREEKGAIIAKKASDIKKLFPSQPKRKREKTVDLTPDLFDGM